MARFIHLAPEPMLKRIRRSGIQPTRARAMMAWLGVPGVDRVVWAFPVTPSFTLSHQWLRELKRKGARTLVAITFRIDDDEPVLARHYNQEPQHMTAAQAVGLIVAQPDPLGYEVMIPRRIRPSEIVAARAVPQKVGWRTIPDRKLLWRTDCTCPMCIPPGAVKSARRRADFHGRYNQPGG